MDIDAAVSLLTGADNKQAYQALKDLIAAILTALEKTGRIYDESIQSLVYKDRQRAIRQIRQYTR